jgi:hypothetical protein
MGQGDVPTSRGGPLRRRREKRQLELLASTSVRDGTPRTSAAHVKVIGDEGADAAEAPDRAPRDEHEHEHEHEETPTSSAPPAHIGGFHVKAVPIDQPVGGGD